jgi:N-acetylglucosaminyldiphosphoundecaprenol N-acetyl-beta-D-mannosaminyltransferase
MNSDWLQKVDILGCRVNRLDLAGAVLALEELLASGTKHQVVCLTVDSIMAARRNPRLRSLYNAVSLALPDGIPVVWASRFLGEAVPGRAAGPDLLLAVSKEAALKGHTFFLMGGGNGVAERLAEVLCGMCPGLRVVGTYSPPFFAEFPAAVNARIVARINAVKPDVLWVGLGAGKQDLWIAENLPRLDVRVAIGVGAAFDMYGGVTGRAPLWMQRSGLEWFFRFLREPRRLFRRYFIEGPPFIPLVLLQRLRRRMSS